MSRPEALAHRVDYRRLATQQAQVAGEVALRRLDRVVSATANDGRSSVPVQVSLDFSEDAERRVRVQGRIETMLRLECQRCLGYFNYPMHVTVAGVVVSDDESAASVPRDDEPMMADGESLDIHGLVADELLLALPPVARCNAPACAAVYAGVPDASRDTGEQRDTYKPFAALDTLKRDD